MKRPKAFDTIVLLGPTASGKTGIAARLAHSLKSCVISADSRQVYREMNIGTGKDYNDYIVEGEKVPVWLIDQVEPGYKYNVFEYQRDFSKIYRKVKGEGKIPVICGGSGLYLEAVLRDYNLIQVPENRVLREKLSERSDEELTSMLRNMKTMHNTTDITQRKRLIRAIEIETYYKEHDSSLKTSLKINALVAGIAVDRETRRNRITERLHKRLSEGMIEEVRKLLKSGIPKETLIYYGLEYKYITRYLTNIISYDEMASQLETAIHQFAKRQMTWFRGMEKRGIQINWVDGSLSVDEKVEIILNLFYE